VLALAGGGATVFMLKKKAADAAAAEEAADEDGVAKPAHTAAKSGHRTPPAFLPLDPFVVNLADREADRFAQIGITLEVDDPKFADEMKAFMPAIRNGILMVLAHKTSQQLLERSGKEALAEEIMREAVRPMGIEIDAEPKPAAEAKDAAPPEGDEKPKAKKKPKKAAEHNPVQKVHFSSFIVQ
jgi:flagellar protein FliL